MYGKFKYLDYHLFSYKLKIDLNEKYVSFQKLNKILLILIQKSIKQIGNLIYFK